MKNMGVYYEKPTAAFVLSLIGGILVLIWGVIIGVLLGILGGITEIAGIMNRIMLISILGGIFIILAVGVIILGILMVWGAFMINSGVPSEVRNGGIIVLIVSVISIFFGGGFFIGSLLGIIGGILALVWEPSHYPAAQS